MTARIGSIMTPTTDCWNIIKETESLVLKAYLCPSGVPTIGWGHTGPDVTEEDVHNGRTCTVEEATIWLGKDIDRAAYLVNIMVSVKLAQNQFDALTSFVFNVGANNFRDSKLLRVLNGKDYTEVPSEMARWVYGSKRDAHGNKIKLAGLVHRRSLESNLWNYGKKVTV